MPGLLQLCKEQFDTSELYAVLGVKKAATANELRKGYHCVSLKVHPDRAQPKDKASATAAFQTLGRVYHLLADPDLRTIYDDTGEVSEEGSAPETNKDWMQYWRQLFRKITVQDITNFEKEYVGSTEEAAAVKAAYKEGRGCMDHVMKCVLLCTAEDEPRFRELIDGWIAEGAVDAFDAYVAETNKKKKQRKRKATKEAAEAVVAAKELGLSGGDEDLSALILARGRNRAAETDAFLDDLAAKYAKPAKKGRTKKK